MKQPVPAEAFAGRARLDSESIAGTAIARYLQSNQETGDKAA